MKKTNLCYTEVLSSMRYNKLEKYIKKNTMNHSLDLPREAVCFYESNIDSGRNVVLALNALSINDYYPQYEVYYENANNGPAKVFEDFEEAFEEFRVRFEQESRESSYYLLCKLAMEIKSLNKSLFQNTETKRFSVLVKETLKRSKYKHITLQGLEDLLEESIDRLKKEYNFSEVISEDTIKVNPERAIIVFDKLITDMISVDSKEIEETFINICNHYSIKLKNMWKLSKEYNKYGKKLLKHLV